MNYDRLFRPSGDSHSPAMEALRNLRMGGVTTFTQSGFRGRNDDGSETTATWKAALNTNFFQPSGETFRLRFQVSGAGGSGSNIISQLQENYLGGGWVNVTTLAGNKTRALNSVNVTDGTATTEQLAGSGNFAVSEISTDARAAQISVGPGSDLEVEFVIIIDGEVNNGDTIQYRVINDATEISAYTVTPTVTVGSGAAVKESNLLVLGVS